MTNNKDKAIQKAIDEIKENLKQCYRLGIIDNEQLDEVWKQLFVKDKNNEQEK